MFDFVSMYIMSTNAFVIVAMLGGRYLLGYIRLILSLCAYV